MKITIKKDGSLIIDGENNTVITAKASAEAMNYIVSKDGKVSYSCDFINIVGGSSNAKHEITNFHFITNNPLKQ